MDNDYLWDRSGDDAEVQRLEDMLAVYRFTGSRRFGGAPPPPAAWSWRPLAAAAAIILAVSRGVVELATAAERVASNRGQWQCHRGSTRHAQGR